MDKQTYLQLDRIEIKIDTLLKLQGLEIDQTGLPITPQTQKAREALTEEKKGRIKRKEEIE